MLTGARGDVLGDRVGLEECEEGLFDGEVTGIPGRIDVGLASDLASISFGLNEAAVIGRQRLVVDGGDVGRERDQVVEPACTPVLSAE